MTSVRRPGARPALPPAARRLRTLLLVVALAAAALLVGAAVATAQGPAPASWAFLALVALATLGSDATLIDLRIGHHVESYTWAEVNFVVGLALLAPRHLVLTSVCILLACLVTRWPLTKAVYNTAVHAIGLALAAVVTHAIADPAWDRPLASGLALAAGAATFSAWNVVSVKAAIALSQELPFLTVLRRNAGMVLVVGVGNLAVALCGLALGRYSLDVLLALPVVLVVVHVGYRSHLRVLEERQVWQHLEATSREMGGLDEQQIAEVAVVRAATLLQADEVEVCLHGDVRDAVHVGDAGGRREVVLEQRQRADRFSITTEHPLVPTPDGLDAQETCVVVPLHGRQQQIGALRVRFHGRVDLSGREQQLLTTYAHALSANLDNARLYRALQEQAARHEQAALHDGLTGLANRALLRDRVAVRSAQGSPFALLLLDLDRFKQVNDGHGHAAGDALLREVADRMRLVVGAEGTVARLGGDEFAVLVDAARAPQAAARLAEEIARPVDLGSVVLHTAASVGLALAPQDGGDLEELLEHADREMYRAKHATRAGGAAYDPFPEPAGRRRDVPAPAVLREA